MSGEAWPDVEGAVRDYLRADTDVLASAAGARSFFAVPGEPTFPLITVIRLSGGEGPSEVPIETALVQVDVWGRVKRLSEAEAVRQAVRRALSKVRTGTQVGSKAILWGCQVVDDRRLPEPNAQDADGQMGDRPRYVLTVSVTSTAVSG